MSEAKEVVDLTLQISSLVEKLDTYLQTPVRSASASTITVSAGGIGIGIAVTACLCTMVLTGAFMLWSLFAHNTVTQKLNDLDAYRSQQANQINDIKSRLKELK